MSKDQTEQLPSSSGSQLNIIIGGAGIGLLLAAAGVAYLRSSRGEESGRFGSLIVGMKGKWALHTTIKLIENDASRKILLGVLKSIAKGK
jgi:hypothetical protein